MGAWKPAIVYSISIKEPGKDADLYSQIFITGIDKKYLEGVFNTNNYIKLGTANLDDTSDARYSDMLEFAPCIGKTDTADYELLTLDERNDSESFKKLCATYPDMTVPTMISLQFVEEGTSLNSSKSLIKVSKENQPERYVKSIRLEKPLSESIKSYTIQVSVPATKTKPERKLTVRIAFGIRECEFFTDIKKVKVPDDVKKEFFKKTTFYKHKSYSDVSGTANAL